MGVMKIASQLTLIFFKKMGCPHLGAAKNKTFAWGAAAKKMLETIALEQSKFMLEGKGAL